MEREFDNEKDGMCVVTEMEYTMKKFEEKNMMEYLDEEEAKFTLKKKRLESALTRYMSRKEKLRKT